MGLSHVQSIRRLCSDQAEIAALSDMTEANLQQALQIAPSAKVLRLRRNSSARRSTRSSFPRRTSRMQILFPASWRPESICFWKSPAAFPATNAGVCWKRPIGATECSCWDTNCATRLTFNESRNWWPGAKLECRAYGLDSRIPGAFSKKVGNWIQDDRKSGGCLVDKNCHHFDLMNWWVGARPKRVAALGGCAVNRVIEGAPGP